MFPCRLFCKLHNHAQALNKSTRLTWLTMRNSSFAVVYRENGDPNKVLEEGPTPASDQPFPAVKRSEIAIKMLAAPINPADINMIQGVYPIRPSLPAIGGNEGVAEIVAVGDAVKNFSPGDWVVPMESGWGTWRTHAVVAASDMMKVPNDIPAVSAATIGVNACTAYRMLKDFVDLNAGDVVIQNGANSGVGQAVIQIAKEFGLQTVNIVRKRDNLQDLENVLKAFGATHVITDEFVRTAEMKELMKLMPKPKLALNCVSGKSAAELLKHLEKQGTMVTYGGMSKQPLMVPAGPLIFSDAILRGYWMTRWSQENKDSPERQEMWDYLCSMVKNRTLQLPLCDLVPFRDFKQAVTKSMEPFVSKKQILVMDDSYL